jgi:mycofactocin precursor
MQTAVLIADTDIEVAREDMADPSSSAAKPEDLTIEADDDLLVEEIRLEDVSIDGMCGVY